MVRQAIYSFGREGQGRLAAAHLIPLVAVHPISGFRACLPAHIAAQTAVIRITHGSMPTRTWQFRRAAYCRQRASPLRNRDIVHWSGGPCVARFQGSEWIVTSRTEIGKLIQDDAAIRGSMRPRCDRSRTLSA